MTAGNGGPPGDGLRRTAIVGALWSGLEKWAARLISTLVFIVLARLLDPAAFGLIALATAIIEVVERLREQGLSLALVQKREVTERELHSAFWFSIAFGAVLAILLAALAQPLAELLGEPQLREVLRWLAVGFLIGAVGRIPNAIVLRRLEFRALALRGVLANIVAGAVAVALALLGAGVWALVAQNILQALVTTIVVVAIARYRPEPVLDLRALRPLWSVGSRVLGYDLVQLGQRRGDDFIIGILLGAVSLGYYTVGYRLLMVLSDTMMRTVQQVVVPTFSRIQDDAERVSRAFIAATKVTSSAAMPAAIGIAVVAPEMVRIVFGNRWLPSVPAMQWLCLTAAVQTIDYFVFDVLLATGHAGVRLRLLAVRTVLVLGAYTIAALVGDFVTVAMAGAIVTLLFVPVSLVAMHHTGGLDRRGLVKALAPVIVATVTMAAGTEAVRQALVEQGDVVTLAVCIPTGVVLYAVTLAFIGRSHLRDLRSMLVSVRGR